ncbi:MAG TPA: LEA type 2 family protein [Longimicrobiales bacterium]|nr:LEA type 2 family protein [Longimicrobiales bacterium]
MRRNATAVVTALVLGGCASLGLGGLLQPPTFRSADDRGSHLRLLGPSAQMPLGGVSLRIWSHVTNPNPFGIDLAGLNGDLYLDGSKAATVDLPMGLPLLAAQDTVIPVDINVDLSDLPSLARVIGDAAGGGSIDYRVEGTIGVSSPTLGYHEFGPSTVVSGTAPVRVF